MPLETSTSPQAQPRTKVDLELSAQSSKDSLASPVDDKQDIEAQIDGEKAPQEFRPPSSKDPNLVEFDGPDDPGNPKNWSVKRRAAITISMGWMTFVVTFSSSIFAVAIEPVSQEFGIGTVVATLGVSFFLLVCLGAPLRL